MLVAILLLGAAAEPELEKGIRQVTDGDFEGALITLDSLARDLAARPKPSTDLVTAYVWLGAAYAGLNQETLAIARLEQALRLDARLTLSAETFPPRVLRLFEAAKREIAEEATLKKQAGAKPKRKGLLLVGAGVAAAGGVALAVAPSERANTPPSARIAISRQGGAISYVTQVTFTADASDAEGDPLSLEWAFGDGATASGSPTTHVYRTPESPFFASSFHVRVRVRDGLAEMSATASVMVLFFNGRSWNVPTPTFDDIVQVDIGQRGTAVSGGRSIVATAHTTRGETKRGDGTVTHPRRVQFAYADCGGSRTFSFDGEVAPGLATIQGTYRCDGPGAGGSCQSCAGRQQPLVLAQ